MTGSRLKRQAFLREPNEGLKLETSAFLRLMKLFGTKFSFMLFPPLNKHFQEKKAFFLFQRYLVSVQSTGALHPDVLVCEAIKVLDREVQTFSVRIRQPLHRYVTQCCH